MSTKIASSGEPRDEAEGDGDATAELDDAADDGEELPGWRCAVFAKYSADAWMPGPSNHPKSRRAPW